jgi:spore maturation protein CgeB
MIRVFNESLINLNLANASAEVVAPSAQLHRRARYLVGTTLNAVLPGRAERRAQQREAAPPMAFPRARARYHEQIKGRNFEVPGCGGFMLTGRAENIEQYYEPGRELVLFDGADDLRQKVRYYLDHPDERDEIAIAGYERTLRDHTYELRFRELFDRIGAGR